MKRFLINFVLLALFFWIILGICDGSLKQSLGIENIIESPASSNEPLDLLYGNNFSSVEDVYEVLEVAKENGFSFNIYVNNLPQSVGNNKLITQDLTNGKIVIAEISYYTVIEHGKVIGIVPMSFRLK